MDGLPQRVLLVLGAASGGIGHHVQALEEHLLARGVAVTVACPGATQQVFGFRGHVPCAVGSADPVAAARALARLRRLPGDLVHAHGLRAGAVAVLSRRRPLVVTWHNAQLGGSRTGALLERLAARGADVTLAASADLALRARELGARDVSVAPVPAPDRAPTGKDPGLGRPLVLAVGRLASQKGYEVLLDALPAFPDAVVAVAGDGPLREELARRAPQVRWLGRREDVADLYAAADVVVLPSRWEARSLTAQEALRAGRPLVATAVGGLPELLRDGAVLVPPGDAAALGAAVRRLLDDPAAAAALAARGREVAAGWPTAVQSWQQVEAAYARALQGPSPRGGRLPG